MEELKRQLNSSVTFNNLCEPEIIELSQRLDKQVVEEQKKMSKRVNKLWR
ncbi:aspartyl-phosphate phosphatase Spo0E family protein [Clostridium gasigenes]|nr:aspartyl-phosphate phosphatase Spo0E family protein [Clostridium gasigenes]MBB6622256.1 aspartyl-phosphate phosphatase Spo0E family protein [Clostridium gasigenes]